MPTSPSLFVDLHRCLAAQSRRTLQAIAQAYGWPFDTSQPKVALVQTMDELLRTTASKTAVISELSTHAQAALRALLQAAGQLPKAEFVYRFGVLRPYRPWREDAPATPWAQPASPTEELFYHGLIFPVNLGTSQRPVSTIVLPVEYHAALTEHFEISSPPSSLPAAPVATPALLVHLFHFFSLLNRERIRPLHGRWLPPYAFKRLLPLLPPTPADAPSAAPRSELQLPYLTFLHYLAEAAGCVAVTGGVLKPTAAALAWLRADLPTRLGSLWAAWTAQGAQPGDLWRRYRLPLAQEEDPPARFAQFCALLADRPPVQQRPGVYVDTLAQQEPALLRAATSYQSWMDVTAEAQSAYQDVLREDLIALLTGPLTWLGLLDVVPASKDARTLSPLGAQLLGRAEGAWPPAPPPVGLEIAPLEAAGAAESVHLHWVTPPPEVGGIDLAQRLDLEVFAARDTASPEDLHLTRDAVTRAWQQGRTVEGLLHLLEAAAGPLPPALVGTLYRWSEALEVLTVRQVVLLEAQDPDLLQTLTQQRSIRETLLETFSARAVRVDAGQLARLLRRLARQGYYPQLDLGERQMANGGARDLPALFLAEQSGQGTPSADPVIIAAALRVYATLCELLGTGARPPYTLLQTWQQALDLAQRDTAAQLADEVLTQLRHAAPPAREYHIPMPTGPLLEALERAIADQATVEITYYTAGRDAVSQRRIDPLRLEWRHDIAYVIAYCHLRQAQRIFRVDRIEELEREM